MQKFLKVAFKILGDMYAAIWKNTAGRPFTYIMREWVVTNPGKATILLPIIFIALLVVARLYNHLWVVCVCAFFWLLTGHTLWDTAGEYIKPRRYKKAK